jgi:uncharacterized protein YceK
MVVAGKAETGTDYGPVIGIVDMPFSLIADVIFIPHDYSMVKERKNNQRLQMQFESDEQVASSNR